MIIYIVQLIQPLSDATYHAKARKLRPVPARCQSLYEFLIAEIDSERKNVSGHYNFSLSLRRKKLRV